MMRRLRFLIVFLCFSTTPCLAWGPTAHTLIVRHAIQLLPPEMKPFYEANSRYLEALVTLPDDWRQTHATAQNWYHCINLEQYDKPPFTRLMAERETLGKDLDSEDAAKKGLAPWAIRMRFEKLVKALKAGDMEEAVFESSIIGHYVGDLHMPLHATEHYDGKTAAQKGIHGRWEGILVDLMLKPESVKPQSPENVSDVLKSALDWSIASYYHVDALLAADDKARALYPTYGFKYYRSLFEQTGPMMIGQISRAAQATAGVWVAAWEQAGKPKLEQKAAPLYWGR